MKLFDAHCHLQDKRVIDKASQLISAALAVGVTNFAVNGTSEKDWNLVKEMGEMYPSVVPCFGLHPWFIADRSPHWLKTLRKFFETTPTAAVGEIGLDKSPLAAGIDYSDQLVVFCRQLELAKQLNKPVSVHCIDAFDDLLEIMRSVGPFPASVILHSFNGSAEVVPKLAELGAYFSLSGWFTYIDEKIAKKTLKSIPSDRFLLETDSPDGLPKADESSSDPNPTLNEPANILAVLDYVANLSNMKKEELAELTYGNIVTYRPVNGVRVCVSPYTIVTSSLVKETKNTHHLLLLLLLLFICLLLMSVDKTYPLPKSSLINCCFC